mgnify:CR=1
MASNGKPSQDAIARIMSYLGRIRTAKKSASSARNARKATRARMKKRRELSA